MTEINEAIYEHFDPHDPALVDDPYTAFAAMRERCPVAHSDQYGGFWALVRHEDVQAAAANPEVFASGGGVTLPSMGNPRPLIPLELDGTEHRGYRKLLTPLFSPRSIAKLEPVIREIVGNLIDGFIEKGQCDLVTDYSRVLPPSVLAHIMGVDQEWIPRFIDWSFRILESDPRHPEAEAFAAIGELYGYFGNMIDAMRAEDQAPGGADGNALEFTDNQRNMLKILLWSELDGEPLTREAILDTLLLNVLGGSDTTNSLIGTALLYLSNHPEERERLRSDPSLIPAVLDELLRIETPIQGMARTVTQDIMFGGQQLHQGDKVLLCWGAANRDPEEFPNPDEVILDRHPNRHLAFGAGPHRCIGSHLGKLQAQVAIEGILTRLPDFRLADGGTLHWAQGHTRNLHSFPVVFTPGARRALHDQTHQAVDSPISQGR